MGANKANPAAMILSSTMLLRHLGLESQANVIASSVYDVIKEGKIRTADMGGKFPCSTSVLETDQQETHRLPISPRLSSTSVWPRPSTEYLTGYIHME